MFCFQARPPDKLFFQTKRFNLMRKLSFVLALALSVFAIQSCQKDDTAEPVDPYAGQEAPQLPAAETFVMPIKPFTELDDGREAPGWTQEVTSRSINNWGYSAGTVLVWNTVLTVHLAIPTLAFFESFNHQAEYQGGGVWLWAYEFTGENGATYQAELYGELLPSAEVKWDMYISQTGGFPRVHWYSGTTANDRSYARWALNFDPNNPRPFINIDFQRDNGNGAAAIRYTNSIPGVPENGGYIEYREGAGAADGFDRAYEVYKAEIDNLLEINWDSVNKNGRVKDAEKFQDQEWHCWGTDLQDTDC